MKGRNIINGVDVSGCMFCKDSWRCTSENIWSDNCSSVPDCIYKLKKLLKERLKEIYKLKKTISDIKEIIYYNKNNRLSGGANISIEQILQKINEVENK